MIRLFHPIAVECGQTVSIIGAELHYLARVRRVRVGESVEVRDPLGRRFAARIEKVDSAEIRVTIERETKRAPKGVPVTLIISVPKRQLMDDIVRYTSELGIERIIPVRAERSVARPSSARLERWIRIATESVRQCGREKPLKLEPVAPLQEALEATDDGKTKVILHPKAQIAFKSLLDAGTQVKPLVVAIGPEGGFTEAEVALAQHYSFLPARMGELTLRVETAALAAAALAAAHLGSL